MSTNWTQAWISPGLAFFIEKPTTSIQLGGLTLTDNNGALAANGVDVAATWSLYPAINDEFFMNSIPGDRIRVIDGDLYFNNELIATEGNISNVSDWSFYPALHPVEMIQENIVWEDPSNPLINYTLNGSTGQLVFRGSNLDPSTWSRYPALQDVNFANFNLNSGNQINCKKVFGNGTSNIYSNILELLADGNIYIKPGTITNLTTESVCLIQTTGGIGGHVIIEGNPGGSGFLNPGIVDVIANPSVSPDGNVGRGGTVNIIANSAIGLEPALTQTSKVVLSGASVLSYAGYVAPFLSTAGYNYIWGGLGVDIQCDVVPPIVPNFAGTIYLFGRLGVAIGTAQTLGTDYGLFASLIQPYSDGLSRPDLIISGKFSANVILRDVAEIVGDGCVMTNIATINGSPYVSGSQWSLYSALANVNFNNFSISNVSNIVTSNINGIPYVSGSQWSSFPALSNVNMNGFSLSNLVNINGVGYVPTSQWSTIAAIQPLNMAENQIVNVTTINAKRIDFRSSNVFISESPELSGHLFLRGNTRIDLATPICSNAGYYTTDVLIPTLSNELATKFYVDSLSSTDWSSFPALSNVNMNGFSLSNLVNINGVAYVPTSQWSTFSAVSSVNMANQGITSIASIYFGAAGGGTPVLQVTGGGVVGIATSTPFINSSYYLTQVLTPTQPSELCSKDYVDRVSQITTVDGNSTVTNPSLTTAFQEIGRINGLTVPGNQKMIANATITIRSSVGSKHDVTYFMTFNGVQLGSQMISTISGNGHYATLAITGYSGPLVAGTYNLILYAKADANSVVTVTALNINAIENLA
jgi:hypothetical protein